MPQKKNPDPLELTRSKTAIVTSNLVSVLGIVKALPSGYSRDLQDMKAPLLGASAITLDTIKIMDHIVRSLQVNEQRMRQAASTSYAIAVDIAEQLSMQKKVPFRTAHRIVGALVSKAAGKGNTPLATLEFDEVRAILDPYKVNTKPEELMKIIHEMTPEKSIEARKSSGSPNLLEQEEMIKSLSEGIANYSVGIQKRTRMVEGSFYTLERTVKSYLSA
jgi:argininosuccinate lyase